MADEAISSAAALIAINEDERQLHHKETEVDVVARKIENRVMDLVGGLSSWWGGVHSQTQSALETAKTHVEENGGIINTAKAGLEALDARMQTESDRARQISRSSTAAEQPDAPFELAGHDNDDDDETVFSSSLKSTASHMDVREQGEKGRRSSDAASSWSAMSANAWESLKKLAYHPQIEQLQTQIATLNANAMDPHSFQTSLKDVEVMTRQYMNTSGATLHGLTKELQARYNALVAGAAAKESASASKKGKEKEAETEADEEPPHVVGGDDDFAWDDDDEIALPTHPTSTAMNHTMSSSLSKPASNDDDIDWE